METTETLSYVSLTQKVNSEGVRRQILPSEVRKSLYYKALSLHKEYHLNYSEIMRYLSKESKLNVSYCTIRRWLRGEGDPEGRCHHFVPRPSPDLSRVIGEVLGDGYLKKPMRYKNQLQRGRIRFAVIDNELAEDFSVRAARLLGRGPYKIYLRDKKRRNPRYEVQVASIQLWDFFKQPFYSLRQYIEPYSTYFISAIFDTEGGPTVSLNRRGKTVRLQLQVLLSNTNRSLVEYVRELLNRLEIHCEIVERPVRNATHIECDGCEREIRPARPSWQLAIYRRISLKKFAEKVGFVIKRKQEKLLDALNLQESYGPTKAAKLWQKLYEKRRRMWVRRF